MEKKSKVYVVGHKNPDTDSICSAIAYAELKRKITGDEYVAKRAGQINEETHYVLQKFGVTAPALLDNVKLQVKDILLLEYGILIGKSSQKSLLQNLQRNNANTKIVFQKNVSLITKSL